MDAHTHTHTSLDTDKDCDLLQGRPVHLTEKTPHDKKKSNCLDKNKIVVLSP